MHGNRVVNYNVAWDELSRLDILFLTTTNRYGLHGNVTLQACDDIGGLLLLVPADSCVQHQDADNHTEVDPVTQTGSEQYGGFHDCQELACWLAAAVCTFMRRSLANVRP